MRVLFLIFCFLFLMIKATDANEVISQLDNRMQAADSLVCIGLDPDVNKIPLSIVKSDLSEKEKVFSFLSQIVDITSQHVCCYKIQKAFFDQLEEGHALLKEVCNYIHQNYEGIPVFIDCKIGDIDNTMSAYMHLIFEDIQADGVVINPYMGDDVLEPFMNDPKKVGIILIQTSNPNAKIVQELELNNGKALWEEILDLTLNRWNINSNLILVLSSNSTSDYSKIRDKIPTTTPILLAGIGSQGGNPKIMQQLLNDDKRGVFVNSSRGIIYSYSSADPNWREEVLKATLKLKNLLNDIRNH